MTTTWTIGSFGLNWTHKVDVGEHDQLINIPLMAESRLVENIEVEGIRPEEGEEHLGNLHSCRGGHCGRGRGWL